MLSEINEMMISKVTNSFKDRLTELVNSQIRDNDGMTQKQIAQKIGISEQNLSNYLSHENRRLPRADLLFRISRHFNVSVDFLLGRSEGRTPDKEAIHRSLGLSNRSIEMLKVLNDQGKPNEIGKLPYGPFVIEAIDILLSHKEGVEALANIFAFMGMFHGKVYNQNGEPVDIINLYSSTGIGLAHVDLQYMEGSVLLMVLKELQNVKEELRKHVDKEDS